MKLQKYTALFVFTVFFLHLHFLPLLYGLTVEEQAGEKTINKKRIIREGFSPSGSEELFGRVVEDRDYTRKPMKKDPRLACLLSLVIPGGGHIYLRRDLKGIAFYLTTVTGYSVTGYYLYRSFIQDKGPDFKSKVIVSGLLFFISALVHVVGIVEAYSDAEEMNKKSFYGMKKLKSPYIARIIIE